MMIPTILLFGFLAVAAYTDIRWGRIYNSTVYTGIVTAVGLNALASAVGHDEKGFVGWADSLTGLAVCGLIMVVCYVLFAGGVGGGDVKLIAMLGAFLGLYAGIEAMLWTFVLAGCTALVMVIWRFGALQILRRAAQYLIAALRLGMLPRLSDEERRPLKRPLFLSPSAMAAAFIVRFRLLDLV